MTVDGALIETAARAAHEANRAIQAFYHEPDISPPWDEAPQWQKDSALDGVVKAIGGATPEELHQSWLDFKIADGWTYGAKKDENLKTHPCIVEYERLPQTQRLKDFVFQAVVTAVVGG